MGSRFLARLHSWWFFSVMAFFEAPGYCLFLGLFGKQAARAELRFRNKYRYEYLTRLYFCPHASVSEKKSWMRSVYELGDGYFSGNEKFPLKEKDIFYEVWKGDSEDLSFEEFRKERWARSFSARVQNVFYEMLNNGYSYQLPDPLKDKWVWDFYDFCRKYHLYLAERISHYRGSMTHYECFNKLSELLVESVYWKEYRAGKVSFKKVFKQDFVDEGTWHKKGCSVFEEFKCER